MTDLKTRVLEASQNNKLVFAQFSRRSFLKGALAVGGVLALAGCTQDETVDNTTTTAANTATATTAPSAPEQSEIQPVITTPSYIIPEYTHCVGCYECMVACSFKHGFGADIEKSNIKVHSFDIKGGMVDIPILCMKCNDTPCMAVCPDKVAAISVDEVTGAVKIDHEKCTLCGLCIDACAEDRTGCLSIDEEAQILVGMCDLCDGNPECVIACPETDCLLISAKTIDGKDFALKPDVLAWRVAQLLYDVDPNA